MAAAVEQQHARAIVGAAERGDLGEVRRLVQQNRIVLDPEWDSTSPLTAAALEGHLEVVRYLLDEGADIDLWTWEYGTALEAASLCGRLEVVALLLARGADTAPDRHGWTPLKAASSKGHTNIVELLLAYGCGDIDAQGLDGSVALHFACINGQAGVVRALLGAGANPHLVDDEGDTPLALAAQEGHEECVAALQVIELRAEIFTVSASLPSGTHLTQSPHLSQSHRRGRAATSSPRPAASAMLLPPCNASARQAMPPPR
jgi:ankyrin repeat protein